MIQAPSAQGQPIGSRNASLCSPPTIPAVPVEELGVRLGLPALAAPRSATAWDQWSMDRDDGPILSSLMRAMQPRRHLEFGTWQGAGAQRVLEACDAAVWSINLPEGEAAPDGAWRYAEAYEEPDQAPRGAGPPQDFRAGGGKVYYQSDAHAFIARQVHDAKLGHRFCQILCDSREWDTGPYPAGFFDSTLIDGGHAPDVVESDTRKAVPLVREGGLLLWHDYCPAVAPDLRSPAQAGVVEAIHRTLPWLRCALRDLFWIEPTQLLLGVRGTA